MMGIGPWVFNPSVQPGINSNFPGSFNPAAWRFNWFLRLGSGVKLLSSALTDFILKMSCLCGGGHANPEAAGKERPLSPHDSSEILQLYFFQNRVRRPSLDHSPWPGRWSPLKNWAGITCSSGGKEWVSFPWITWTEPWGGVSPIPKENPNQDVHQQMSSGFWGKR